MEGGKGEGKGREGGRKGGGGRGEWGGEEGVGEGGGGKEGGSLLTVPPSPSLLAPGNKILLPVCCPPPPPPPQTKQTNSQEVQCFHWCGWFNFKLAEWRVEPTYITPTRCGTRSRRFVQSA